jgi:hypothetical protein
MSRKVLASVVSYLIKSYEMDRENGSEWQTGWLTMNDYIITLPRSVSPSSSGPRRVSTATDA